MSTVLHIEVPRALTMGIREFDVRTSMQLEENGVSYDQRDINPFFWEYMFRKYAPDVADSFGEILHRATEDPNAYVNVTTAFNGINSQLASSGMKLDADGLYPLNQSMLDSSTRIQNFLEGNSGDLVAEFCAVADVKFGFGNYKLISIGVTGRNSFILAFGLAKYLREKHPEAHLCIGRHHYENFSLLLTLDKIIANKSIFANVHSFSLYEEKLGDTLLGILSGNEDRFTNCAWIKSGEVIVRQPVGPVKQYHELTVLARAGLLNYIESIGVPAANMHYNMQLIGNQCYYSRCTFCAQINKHLSNHVYEEHAALNLSFSVVQELVGMGVVYFSFTDEALRPHDLVALANRIQNASLNIRWNMRLIANTKVSVELVEKLYKAGCREVLFGLETIDMEIATAMGKVSSKDEVNAVSEMVFNFTPAGITVILSMIYGFPGFGPEKDEELISYARKMLTYNPRVLFIFNRFILFGGTPMFANPEQYGIKRLAEHASDSDLGNSYKYEPTEVPARTETIFRILNLHPCKNPTQVFADPELQEIFERFHQFRYTSFGFTYAQQYKAELYSRLTAVYETV